MAETLPGNSFVLKQSTGYNRVFYFGTTGQTVVVNLSKNAAAFGAAAGAVSEIASGWYNVALTVADTGTLGILAYHCTAASGGPADFSDFVQATVFTDLVVDASGNVSINSSIKKNATCNGFSFVMTNSTTHIPQTGLAVSAQRSLAGAGFAPCANAVTELSNGIYSINLATADTNASSILLRFTATGADDLDILILTQP